METGFRLYKDDETPLYIQTADTVRASIVEGEFRPGDRLPSVRKLSDELGVNPATIVAAYRILTREGFVEARAGSGAYVAEGAPLVDGPASADSGRTSGRGLIPVSERSHPENSVAVIDMAANAPPLDLFPLDDIKRFIVEAIDADGGRAFEYEDTAGYRPLKTALAVRLAYGRSGSSAVIDPDDVHIVSGAQQGIDLAARVLLRRGDVAAVESPGYHGARDAFVATGARVEAVPLLSDGIDLRSLERLAASRPLRLVHVNPIFQNPTGMVYAQNRREELARLAERYGFYVIEDDLFSDLAWDGSFIASVRSFDTAGRVIFVKSFSKSLMPGLRIACLEAPPQLRERFESVKRSIDISSNGLMQRVLERFLSSGRFDEHLAAARLRYRSAYETFADALEPYRAAGLSWERPLGGINLWLGLPSGVAARSLAAACLASGCALAPEISFRYEPSAGLEGDTHVRVSFGSVTADSLERGALVIGAALGKLGNGRPDAGND
ncbi:MAG: hypothetical protein A2Y38_05130 [Spirochaetes bacterium GWB1_59_5]|nr:MAG: hypothetical protein A2Y38_05130 [Spirochaetes bacterium GWB1_59_5]